MESSPQPRKIWVSIVGYPFEHKGTFSFCPRLFRADGATRDAIRALTPFLEGVLDEYIKARGRLYVAVSRECPTQRTDDPMLGAVEDDRTVSVFKAVSSAGELKEFYSAVVEYLNGHCPCKYIELCEGDRRCEEAHCDDITVWFRLDPVAVKIDPERFKELFEMLMATDAQLNVETARRLFGREFAERVKQHNQMVRASRKPA